jgi:hypothetical protein
MAAALAANAGLSGSIEEASVVMRSFDLDRPAPSKPIAKRKSERLALNLNVTPSGV